MLAGFDAAKHWLAVSSILLIIGAASVAVPLALRVAASEYRIPSHRIKSNRFGTGEPETSTDPID